MNPLLDSFNKTYSLLGGIIHKIVDKVKPIIILFIRFVIIN